MGKTYTVQILNDKEFDSLPYDGIEDSLGFADVKKGLAFVRSTGNKEFDLGTVSHEVNHLIEKHGKDHPDYESGILHKKGGFFRQIAAPLAGIIGTLIGGPGLGAIAGGLAGAGTDQYAKSNHPEQLGKPGQFGDILGAGALGAASGFGAGGAVTGGIAGGTAAAPGFLSKAGGILSGATLGTAPTATTAGSQGALGAGGKLLGFGTSLAPTSAPALSGAQSAFTNAVSGAIGSGVGSAVAPTFSIGATGIPTAAAGASNLLGNSIANTSKVSAPINSAKLSDAVSNAVGGNGLAPQLGGSSVAPALNASTGSAITPATSAGTAAATKAPFSFKDLLTPSNVLGGASLLGSVATPTPQFQMPDSVEELRSKIQSGNGLTPLGQQAQQSLQEILASTPSQINAPANDAYYADTNRRIDQQYEQAKKQLDTAYNNAGQLGSGEYLDQVRKLSQAQADAKDAYVQSENQRRFEYGSNQKYQAIQQSLGVDQNTMNDLVGLSGLDVQTAAMMYGAKAADVTAIRTALGTLGTQALLKGNGITSQPNVTVQLGK